MKIPTRIRDIAARFRSRVTFEDSIALCASVIAMKIQLDYRVAGHFLFLLLPPVGLALTVLNFVFLINHLLTHLPEDDPFRLALGRIKWWSNLLVRVFVYYSLLLYVNAKLDTAKPTYQNTEIVSLNKGAVLGLPMPYSWVTLRDLANPDKTEQVLLKASERERLWGAQPVLLTIQPGYLGIPWIAAIELDWVHYAGEILKFAPTAAAAWKQLIIFNFQHDRWKDAIKDTNTYLKHYPNDLDFFHYVTGALLDAGQYKESIPLLEYVLAKRPTYDVHQTLGWALSYAGNNPRAAEVLEVSVKLNPDNWEAYYHLGYVYGGMGRLAEGIAAFEKALARNPNSPEMEIELARLRQALAAQQAAQKRRGQSTKPSPSALR
jgi:tetratricopeptide (TPR) repeat protein